MIDVETVTSTKIHELKSKFVQQCRLIMILERQPRTLHGGMTKVLLDAAQDGSIPFLFTDRSVSTTKTCHEVLIPPHVSGNVFHGKKSGPRPLFYDVTKNGPREVMDGLLKIVMERLTCPPEDRVRFVEEFLQCLCMQASLYHDTLKAQRLFDESSYETHSLLRTTMPLTYAFWVVHQSARCTPNEAFSGFVNVGRAKFPDKNANELCQVMCEMIQSHIASIMSARDTIRNQRLPQRG